MVHANRSAVRPINERSFPASYSPNTIPTIASVSVLISPPSVLLVTAPLPLIPVHHPIANLICSGYLRLEEDGAVFFILEPKLGTGGQKSLIFKHLRVTLAPFLNRSKAFWGRNEKHLPRWTSGLLKNRPPLPDKEAGVFCYGLTKATWRDEEGSWPA